jgi:hypothetical protein
MAVPNRSVLFLSIPVAAKAMGVGTARLKRAVACGQIPAIKIGSRRVISVATLERLAQGARR